MINFGEETRYELSRYGYEIKDIDWIGNDYVQISIKNFFMQADKFNYDNGYGSVKVPTDIVIFMKDGNWFTRKEYDGLEGWKFNSVPEKPDSPRYHIVEFNSDSYWPQLTDYII